MEWLLNAFAGCWEKIAVVELEFEHPHQLVLVELDMEVVDGTRAVVDVVAEVTADGISPWKIQVFVDFARYLSLFSIVEITFVPL